MPISRASRASRASFGALALLALSACGPAGDGQPRAGEPTPPRPPTFDFAPGGPLSDAQLGEFHVLMECSADGQDLGALTFALWPEAAPRTVRAFLRMVDEGWYDGLAFHRVLREFVVQGGYAPVFGGGGPYGGLPREISNYPEHEHHYGVISMSDPPSMQFGVCVAESPSVWMLDSQGINAFGRLAHGVAVLEQIAGVKVMGNGAGERSVPLVHLAITRASVRRGPPPASEEIARPRPDLGGEPEIVGVQEILVTFLERGRSLGVTRNRREAGERAREVLGRLHSGELDFLTAMQEYSDRPFPEDGRVGVRRISNYGVVDVVRQRARQDGVDEINAYQALLREQVAEGTLEREELPALVAQKMNEVAEWVRETELDRREEVNGADYARVAFSLVVGEVGLVEYDPFDSPQGWFVLRRVE